MRSARVNDAVISPLHYPPEADEAVTLLAAQRLPARPRRLQQHGRPGLHQRRSTSTTSSLPSSAHLVTKARIGAGISGRGGTWGYT